MEPAGEGGRKGSFADDKNGIGIITSMAISFGRDKLMDLKRLEERMKKGWVLSFLDGLLRIGIIWCISFYYFCCWVCISGSW